MSNGDNKQPEVIFNENDYLAVPTNSLIHRKAAPSDLYIKLPTSRLVKIAHKGGAIDVDRMNRLGEKNVSHLYVKKDEFASVVADLVRSAGKIGELAQVPTDIKLAKFFSIAEGVFTEVMHLPLSEQSLVNCVKMASEISNSLQMRPDFSKAVSAVVSIGEEFAKHSLSSVVAINMLMEQMKWDSGKMVTNLTHAAFFHDIGFKELPKELFYKSRMEMTKDEVDLYITHPTLSVQILSQLNFVSADVLRAVQEHHEMPNGDGFPRHLKGDRVYPLGKVLSFANVLAHEMFDKLQPGQTFDVNDMIARLDGVYSKMYGADLIKKARGIFRKED